VNRFKTKASSKEKGKDRGKSEGGGRTFCRRKTLNKRAQSMKKRGKRPAKSSGKKEEKLVKKVAIRRSTGSLAQ